MPIKTTALVAVLPGGCLLQQSARAQECDRACLQRVPYGMLSGWSDYEAGMSSELQDATFKR